MATLGNRPWRDGYTITSTHNIDRPTTSASGRLTFRFPAPGIVVLRRLDESPVSPSSD